MMSVKIKRVIWIVLMIIPSLMLMMSGIMKLIGGKDVVEALTKGGFGNYILLLGMIELVSVALLLIPKTYKLGFLLVTGYLGGALSIELASGQPPMAAILLTLVWISTFLRNKEMFLNPTLHSSAK